MRPDHRDPAEVVDDDDPVWLTSGRRLAHDHTRTTSGRVVGSQHPVPEELDERHPDDVAAWGLVDGGQATMSSRSAEGVFTRQAKRRDCAPSNSRTRLAQPQARSKRAHLTRGDRGRHRVRSLRVDLDRFVWLADLRRAHAFR